MAQTSSPADIYNQALQQQQALASQIASGYNTLRQQQVAAQNNVIGGYNRLSNQVMGTIGGIGRAEAQRLADQYTAFSGQQAQQLTNRGLANTTIANSVQRGVSLDKAKADVELQGKIAGLQANYLSQIGLAGLGYQGQAVGQQSALGSEALMAQQRFSPTYAQLYSGMADAAYRQQVFEQQRINDTLNRVYAAYGQAGAQTGANMRAYDATKLGQDQLDYRYAALGSQEEQSGGRLGLAYAQLGQQAQQFGANLNYRYDLATGRYGTGSPGAYNNPSPAAPVEGGG